MTESKSHLGSILLRAGSVAFGLMLWHYVATSVIKDNSILVSP